MFLFIFNLTIRIEYFYREEIFFFHKFLLKNVIENYSNLAKNNLKLLHSILSHNFPQIFFLYHKLYHNSQNKTNIYLKNTCFPSLPWIIWNTTKHLKTKLLLHMLVKVPFFFFKKKINLCDFQTSSIISSKKLKITLFPSFQHQLWNESRLKAIRELNLTFKLHFISFDISIHIFFFPFFLFFFLILLQSLT